MTKDLLKLKKELKSFAKRVKNFKYTETMLITFLMTGTIGNLSYALESREINNQMKQINGSISNIKQNFKRIKLKNDKSIKKSNLELIQLMEQGEYVTKSPWSSWQYGNNEFYNDWSGTYPGHKDKSKKYSYEGIFSRSSDIYERAVSPSSENYELLGRPRRLESATGLANGYGLASINLAAEPLVGFEINAGINPRSINKSPLSIGEKTAITPILPTPISFTPPKPIIKLPVLPNLPKPPSFNIKLGSFCNGMSGGCRSYGTDGGQYNYGTPNTIGTPRTLLVGGVFIGYVNTVTLNTNDPSLTHGQATHSPREDYDSGSALFYAYFDALDGNKGPGSSVILNGNLTVTSINPVQSDTSLSSYNRQKFLVGGSRIGTLDNVRDGTLKSNATINLVGPLTVGFEVQSHKRFGANAKARILILFIQDA